MLEKLINFKLSVIFYFELSKKNQMSDKCNDTSILSFFKPFSLNLNFTSCLF